MESHNLRKATALAMAMNSEDVTPTFITPRRVPCDRETAFARVRRRISLSPVTNSLEEIMYIIKEYSRRSRSRVFTQHRRDVNCERLLDETSNASLGDTLYTVKNNSCNNRQF